MPTLQELLLDISKQKSILDSLRPISSENMLKIRQKFVLEYNYHSNHLEGNSLTIQETYSMLMNSYSPRESKPLRDIDELRGHIKTVDALGLLEDVVKDKKDITESLIRDLNRMILVENFKKRRKDENGDDIFVDIIVGQYKTKPNSVVTQTGEMFRFADPAETAPLVHDLLDWYNRQKDILPPLELAAIFHYKFIRIHPFDDGNGRVARLLMNLILQNNGYPIVIISSEEKPKEEYYKALMDTDANLIDLHDAVHNDDTTPFEPFISYIGERLLKSLDWTIRGAKGEDISDIEDIIKEAKLWAEAHSEKNKINGAISLEDLQKQYKVESFMQSTFIPAINFVDRLLISYFKPTVIDVDIEFWSQLKLNPSSNSIYYESEKDNTIRIKISHTNELVNNSKIRGKITKIFSKIAIDDLKNDPSENHFGIFIRPVSVFGDVISIHELDIFINVGKGKWYFSILDVREKGLEVGEELNIYTEDLYYKTEPNEDYKEAIKQPLKELSEFLKKKLSE